MADAVYLVAQIQVKDYEQYMAEYAAPTLDLIQRFGGEVLAATPDARALEGDWYGNWTVILRFQSADAARSFMEAPEYAPLRQARVERLTEGGNVAVVPAYDPAA